MGQSPNSKYYNEEKNGFPLLQGNNDIKNGKTYSKIYTTQVTKECKASDIILSVRAPVGEIGIATEASCLGRGVCAIQSESLYKNYIFNYLNLFSYQWNKFSQGSTFKAINSKDIRGFKIKLPSSKKELYKINQLLSLTSVQINKFKSRKKVV